MTAAPDRPPMLHVEHEPALVVRYLPVCAIDPNAHQPRKIFQEEELAELAASIRETGVLQPITVRPGTTPDRWELVMGERRLRASRMAGKATVPAIVRWVDDENLLLDAVVENLHREDLNPMEEAVAYRSLLDTTGMRHEELARLLGKSRQGVGHIMSLLRLPEEVQRMVAAGVLSRGHARCLVALKEPTTITRLAHRIRRQNLSVRQVEEIVAMGNLPGWEEDPSDPYGLTGTADPPAPHWAADDPRRRRASKPRPPRTLPAVAEVLDDWLETRVLVRAPRGQQRGRIIIEFTDDVDLGRVLAIMGAPAERMDWRPRPTD